MLAQSYTGGTGNCPVSVMQKEQRVIIRKAVSDLSREIERHKLSINEELVEEIKMMSRSVKEDEEEEDDEDDDELQQAVCSCCGLKEECTKQYISEVQRSFSGKWVCGLCSEAVKERVLRFPNTPIDKALDFHREFCDSFNTTTRLNPKLSLTTSMRKIARKSFEKRNSTHFGSNSNRLSRSISCDPRIGLQD